MQMWRYGVYKTNMNQLFYITYQFRITIKTAVYTFLYTAGVILFIINY